MFTKNPEKGVINNEFIKEVERIISILEKRFPSKKDIRFADISDYILDNGPDDELHHRINEWCLSKIEKNEILTFPISFD